MIMYCDFCGKEVEVQSFPRVIDIEKKITKEEYYCLECFTTIYIKESK